jgi:hypothetical protein
MFHPKCEERFAGNKILYKSAILLEHLNVDSRCTDPWASNWLYQFVCQHKQFSAAELTSRIWQLHSSFAAQMLTGRYAEPIEFRLHFVVFLYNTNLCYAYTLYRLKVARIVLSHSCFMPSPCHPFLFIALTLILLKWKIWWASNNASRWQMGFNSEFKCSVHWVWRSSLHRSFGSPLPLPSHLLLPPTTNIFKTLFLFVSSLV